MIGLQYPPLIALAARVVGPVQSSVGGHQRCCSGGGRSCCSRGALGHRRRSRRQYRTDDVDHGPGDANVDAAAAAAAAAATAIRSTTAAARTTTTATTSRRRIITAAAAAAMPVRGHRHVGRRDHGPTSAAPRGRPSWAAPVVRSARATAAAVHGRSHPRGHRSLPRLMLLTGRTSQRDQHFPDRVRWEMGADPCPQTETGPTPPGCQLDRRWRCRKVRLNPLYIKYTYYNIVQYFIIYYTVVEI